MSTRQQKVVVQPINVIFRYLQRQTRVSLWLYDNVDMRLEGKIIGFDEFMNVTLDEAEEVLCTPGKERRPLGRLLLKGDNIVRIQHAAQMLWTKYLFFNLALTAAIFLYVILTPPDAHPARPAVTLKL